MSFRKRKSLNKILQAKSSQIQAHNLEMLHFKLQHKPILILSWQQQQKYETQSHHIQNNQPKKCKSILKLKHGKANEKAFRPIIKKSTDRILAAACNQQSREGREIMRNKHLPFVVLVLGIEIKLYFPFGFGRVYMYYHTSMPEKYFIQVLIQYSVQTLGSDKQAGFIGKYVTLTSFQHQNLSHLKLKAR